MTGNAAVIKPSEVSFHSAKVMEELLPLYLDRVGTSYLNTNNSNWMSF